MVGLKTQINPSRVFGHLVSPTSQILWRYERNLTLKGLFNNVKSEMHGPTCYQCL